MLDAKMAKRGAVHALLTLLYISCVAAVMENAGMIFVNMPEWIAPVLMLSLLSVSAATVGSLIFGKPVMLYIDGQKKEAVALLFWTIAILAVITAFFLAILSFAGTSNLSR